LLSWPPDRCGTLDSVSFEHDKTQRSYDAVAKDYAEHFVNELDHKPLDRAILAALLEQAPSGLPIADLGCGPGHVAAWLVEHGAGSAIGIDLSRAMVDVATATWPNAGFRQGDLCSLPAADGEFGAAVAMYSIIHLAPDELPQAFSEMHRCLAEAGLLLVAFHAGSEIRHRDEFFGHEVDLDFRFLEPGEITSKLEAAGFRLLLTATRVAYPDEVDTTRAYLLAQRT
jgi:ubiquinone/menaquinone biosynthesis C-methylase UbiE